MPCFMLHMMEQPAPRPYDDPDLKDLVGEFPRLFCAQCTPPKELRPSESLRCFERDAPCWKDPAHICDDAPAPPPTEPPPAG